MSHPGSPIAVIGAGFSGTMTALHLMAQVPARQVILCERGPTFARGAAYSTDDPVHMLNVRAANMSAYPERPDDFTQWLQQRAGLSPGHLHETAAGLFVSRVLYGRYLSDLVQQELLQPAGAARLRIVPDEAVGLRRRSDGLFDLTLAGGRTHRVAGAVVAIGNLMGGETGRPGRIVPEPWATRFTEDLEPGRPVIVVGTGLTMVDVVTSLWSHGFPGPVVAISRRGLLPRSHVPPAAWRLSPLAVAQQRELSWSVRAFRREVAAAREAGLPWQSVMDAVRPITASLWRALSPEQQSRFVRHLRPWWDVHRHRMAPPVSQQLQDLVERGFLRVGAGRIVSVTPHGGHVELVWSPRKEIRTEMIAAQRVIYATGAPGVSAVGDTLVDGLREAGLARMDRLGMGLDVTADLEVVGADGAVSPGLWAIGPIVRGAFWECTAVPDIRTDAERLARRIGSQALP